MLRHITWFLFHSCPVLHYADPIHEAGTEILPNFSLNSSHHHPRSRRAPWSFRYLINRGHLMCLTKKIQEVNLEHWMMEENHTHITAFQYSIFPSVHWQDKFLLNMVPVLYKCTLSSSSSPLHTSFSYCSSSSVFSSVRNVPHSYSLIFWLHFQGSVETEERVPTLLCL